MGFSNSNSGRRFPVIPVFSVIGFIVAVVLGFSSFYTVDQREVGVVTRWGRVIDVAKAGFHVKNSISDSVTLYDTAVRQVKVVHEEMHTSDNQLVWSDLNIQYFISPDSVTKLYSQYPDYETRLRTLGQDSFRQVIGQYDSSMIAQQLGEIQSKILALLAKDALRLYGLNVTEVQALNWSYSQEYSRAIDAMTKQKASERQAEIKLQQAKVQALQTTVEAEAQASARKAQADGDAYAVTVNAKAEADSIRVTGAAKAEAIRAQSEAMRTSPQFVQYSISQKWDGKLPVTIGAGAGPGTVPMLDLNALTH